ncbi:asparagine synthase (glutamine-hydrolyzing) [Brevibacillus panacihumi]|uniref:asparagine synthase (glutamine-hydrolyzing) n=1 Tax=Brevibacillus panacihumi TaxID=497735 RepID=UPI003CFE5284
MLIFNEKEVWHMCGIAGIFSQKPIDQLDIRIGKMCDSMIHRGPDASGITKISDKAAIGHSRLSIIDLNFKSNQPMLDNSGRYYLSYNGEIVNYTEIRDELTYEFRTNSDTEVILASIIEKGIDWLLSKAVGMFGFIFYDTLTQTVIIARDHFGIKPVLYSMVDGILVIASEVRTILSSGLIQPEMSNKAIDDYLGYRYVREPYTFFSNIFQVPHGSYITFNHKLTAFTKKYYNLPSLNFSNQYCRESLIQETRERLEKTLNRWIVSDVKIGSYLSGGVDSSLLTAMMAKNISDLDTYSIGFDDERTNEFRYAKVVADLYNTNHKAFLISMDDYTHEWEQLIWYKGAPLGVPNEIPLSLMTSKLSKDVTVVISGEGADELFGGYGRIFRCANDFENGHLGDDFYTSFIRQYEYVPREFRDRYLLGDFIGNRQEFDSRIRNEFENYRNEENIFRFFHTYHIQGLLQRLDTSTMRASVESRPPFLDHLLVDFVYKEIPYELKLRWKNESAMKMAVNKLSLEYSEVLDTPKYILKKVAEYYLPNDIIYRRKMGFPIPLTENNDTLLEMAKTLLKDSEWLQVNNFNSLISDIQKLNNASQTLWMLLNVEKFRKLFFEKVWIY